MHVLVYLKGTIKYRIMYNQENTEDDGLTPIGYMDSYHSDDRTSGKSMMGYVFNIATVHGGQQSLWMGSFLDEIKLSKDHPYPLNCDNNSAINLTQSTKGHGKSKHFAMDYHWICDSIQLGELDVCYITSEDNLADLFTKGVLKLFAKELLRRMGMMRL